MQKQIDKYSLNISSDRELWNIIYGMPNKSYTVLINKTLNIAKALCINQI